MSLFALLGLPIYSVLMYYVLYRYVEPREGRKKQLILCLIVSICLQILIRFCLLSDIWWIAEYNVGKLMTIFMVILLLFWGGSLIRGGWVRIGIYLIVTEIIFSLSSRIFWQIWGIITHASAQDILMHARVVSFDRATGIQLLIDSGIAILLLIPASYFRKLPIKPLRPAQVAVIAYLAYGCMPTTNRTGFDGGNMIPMLVGILCFIVFMFCLFWSIRNTIERDKQHMLKLKQQALSEQAKIIYMQKIRVRRFRHDIKKHLDAMAYLMQDNPELKDDPSFLQYQNEMKTYENMFRRAYYCDSDELNMSLEQIEQYCMEHDIPDKIYLKRMRFPGWSRDDQLVFGMLLNQIFLLAVDDTATNLKITGDCLQGQNIMRIGIEFKDREDTGKTIAEGNDRNIRKSVVDDICQVLSRYGGFCTTQQSDHDFVCLLQWNDGEEICLSTQFC